MVGTIDEILYYVMLKSENAPLFGISRQRMACIRKYIKAGTLKEKWRVHYINIFMETCNPKFTLRRLRDTLIIPAVVCDKHGRLYTEKTLITAFKNQKKFADLHLNDVYKEFACGNFPSQRVVDEVLRRIKGWHIAERVVLPPLYELTYNF